MAFRPGNIWPNVRHLPTLLCDVINDQPHCLSYLTGMKLFKKLKYQQANNYHKMMPRFWQCSDVKLFTCMSMSPQWDLPRDATTTKKKRILAVPLGSGTHWPLKSWWQLPSTWQMLHRYLPMVTWWYRACRALTVRKLKSESKSSSGQKLLTRWKLASVKYGSSFAKPRLFYNERPSLIRRRPPIYTQTLITMSWTFT